MVTLLTGPPIVTCTFEMQPNLEELRELCEWVRDRRPDCIDAEMCRDPMYLFPHHGSEDGRVLAGNELSVELAGRKCYNSFGKLAGQKKNSDYISNTQSGDVPHASIMYHAKMTFFIGGVSRRVSHELIRHYVGADRDEEGSPSQESTRYVEHTGHYVVHPKMLDEGPQTVEDFRLFAESNYTQYLAYVRVQEEKYFEEHGSKPKGIDKKRILESASSLLMHSVETSFIWTTNPMALAKMFKERAHEGADREYQRLAEFWAQYCVKRWPNLFPQPWMQRFRPQDGVYHGGK